jgi:hypothetical protein
MTTQAEFKRLESFVGRELEDRRRIELYRSRSERPDHLLDLCVALVRRRYGYDPESIVARLETLRQRHIAG